MKDSQVGVSSVEAPQALSSEVQVDVAQLSEHGASRSKKLDVLQDIEDSGSKSVTFEEQPALKIPSQDFMTGARVPEANSVIQESWLEIVERRLEDLGPKAEKARSDAAKCKAHIETLGANLKGLGQVLRDLRARKAKHMADMDMIHSAMEAKVVEKNQLSEDIALLEANLEGLNEDDPEGGSDQVYFDQVPQCLQSCFHVEH